ncbi:MAG TPA: hypothetical protein VHN59_12455 [Chitinophagaceae bacterium]|nr:hypothetical protein [Chitinophagaceae bacterium]
MDQLDFEQLLHRRIAQISVGASAIRNQGKKGDKGLIKTCRNYFENEIELSVFFKKLHDRDEYKELLDKHTQAIVSLFPETARSWGAARKGLNLFFRDVVYNKYLADKFNLSSDFISNNKMLENLEIPLDKDVAKKLRERFKQALPKWEGIKHLTEKVSAAYQLKAAELASEKNIARVHLDLEFWREQK